MPSRNQIKFKYSEKTLEHAKELLLKGELVAFPTETVYGLGGRADKTEVIQKIYQAKGRPRNNPLILHFVSAEEAKKWVKHWPENAQKLSEIFWPGPLTLVLPASDKIPLEARAGLPTVAIRVPAHPLALALLQAVQVPLAAPSANPSGALSPTRAEHVAKNLKDKVSLILDGGATDLGIESTVLDLTTLPPRILRPGKISKLEIEKWIGPIEEGLEIKSNENLPSPGLLEKHYSPQAQVIFFEKENLPSQIKAFQTQSKKVAFLLRQLPLISDFKSLKIGETPEGYAKELYAKLHALDDENFEIIAIEAPPETEEWKAIWNRLERMK